MNTNFKIPTLLESEKVIYESAPDINLKKYYVWSSIIGFGFLICVMTFVPLFAGFALLLQGELDGLFLVSFFLIVLIIGLSAIAFLSVWVSEKTYSQRYYWITNKRVIYRRGFLGYSISSLPYERIADVILTRGWFENLFGFGSLQIQTLAGQISTAAGGAEGYLQAIPDPEKVQEIILSAMRGKILEK